MKNIIPVIILMFFISSCSSTSKFPVSSMVPAAEISVKKSIDKNKNYVITVTANNLASADRLSPSRSMYVVWIETAENGLQNIGQLQNQNARKASLKTISSFDPVEILITAEDEGNVSYPAGTEISRTSF